MDADVREARRREQRRTTWRHDVTRTSDEVAPLCVVACVKDIVTRRER
jgi:hypothetical protein